MRLFYVLLLGTTFAPLGAQAQSGACLPDWSAASIVVKAEGLVTVEQLAKLAATRVRGEIVRTALCEDKSGYVYKLLVREGSGQVKTIIVNAKQPVFP